CCGRIENRGSGQAEQIDGALGAIPIRGDDMLAGQQALRQHSEQRPRFGRGRGICLAGGAQAKEERPPLALATTEGGRKLCSGRPWERPLRIAQNPPTVRPARSIVLWQKRHAMCPRPSAARDLSPNTWATVS